MSQPRYFALDAQEAAGVSDFEGIILNQQLVDETGEEVLFDEDLELDNGDWSCGEIFGHDYFLASSRSISFSSSGISLDAKVNATIDGVVNSDATSAENEVEEELLASDVTFTRAKSLPILSTKRKRATVVHCKYCGVLLKHPSKIEAHMRTHTGEKPFECDICGMRFTQRTPMRMHIRRHLNDTPFVCSFGCGKSFVSNAVKNAHELKSHLREKRKGPPRPHLKPPKRFVPLKISDATSAEKQLDFVSCNSFHEDVEASVSKAASEKLDEVINAVAAGVPLVPPKRVRRRRAVIAECGVCGLLLKHPSKIKAHMRIHTGERPFECEFCGMRFATASPLRVHLRRLHTGEKPFECTWDCGRKFVSIAARNEHERIVHAGIKRYQCTIDGCHRFFTRHHYLVIHQSKDHKIVQQTFSDAANSADFSRRKQDFSNNDLEADLPVTLFAAGRQNFKKSGSMVETIHVNLDDDDELLANQNPEPAEINLNGERNKLRKQENIVMNNRNSIMLRERKAKASTELSPEVFDPSLSGNFLESETGEIFLEDSEGNLQAVYSMFLADS